MSGKYFIDTNILVYSFDESNQLKKTVAMELIRDAVNEQHGCISFQVIQEFINVATRKFKKPMTLIDCKNYINSVLEPICDVFTSIGLYHQALEIMEVWKFSFYDSLIIAAALQARCKILFTEDLQHNQIINDLHIINPFFNVE